MFHKWPWIPLIHNEKYILPWIDNGIVQLYKFFYNIGKLFNWILWLDSYFIWYLTHPGILIFDIDWPFSSCGAINDVAK